jgi:hypothetical protein
MWEIYVGSNRRGRGKYSMEKSYQDWVWTFVNEKDESEAEEEQGKGREMN